ncbi:MAG: hypothetical protein A3H29_17575 [Acidobacteria bacterium RIFCSPLOWO2_02_FULL_67_21]|nr:MAG: hypothetical protein A3H29_17575 [Acidobacteria bacterium RIFCSPLOWO2_02_FULL_67_21]
MTAILTAGAFIVVVLIFLFAFLIVGIIIIIGVGGVASLLLALAVPSLEVVAMPVAAAISAAAERARRVRGGCHGREVGGLVQTERSGAESAGRRRWMKGRTARATGSAHDGRRAKSDEPGTETNHPHIDALLGEEAQDVGQ